MKVSAALLPSEEQQCSAEPPLDQLRSRLCFSNKSDDYGGFRCVDFPDVHNGVSCSADVVE